MIEPTEKFQVIGKIQPIPRHMRVNAVFRYGKTLVKKRMSHLANIQHAYFYDNLTAKYIKQFFSYCYMNSDNELDSPLNNNSFFKFTVEHLEDKKK